MNAARETKVKIIAQRQLNESSKLKVRLIQIEKEGIGETKKL